jgi:hypothetical protein
MLKTLRPTDFDGVDCAVPGVTAKTSFCYAVNPSPCVSVHKLIWKIPHPLDVIIKSLILLIPPSLAPKTVPYGGVMVVDPTSSTFVELLQDPNGKDIRALTGITVHENKLYLGSLHNTYIGVYDLTP